MKVEFTSGGFKLLADGESTTDIFTQVSKFQDVFTGEPCGKCGSHDTRCVTRQVKDDTFYEFRCTKCGAKLALGVKKEKNGGLFAKRQKKDDKGEVTGWLPDNGWVKWDAKLGENV